MTFIESVRFLTDLGYTISFKKEGNQLSIRLLKKTNQTTIRQIEQLIPRNDLYITDENLSAVLEFCMNKINDK